MRYNGIFFPLALTVFSLLCAAVFAAAAAAVVVVDVGAAAVVGPVAFATAGEPDQLF